MECLRRFRKAHVSRQLQVIIVLSTFAVFVAIALAALVSFYWLSGEILQSWEKARILILQKQFSEKSAVIVQYLNDEFEHLIEYTKNVAEIIELILGDASIYKSKPPVNHLTITPGLLLFTTGCYMTRFSYLSIEGEKLMEKEAAMDIAYPLIFRNNVLGIYSGYLQDEILHYYPCNYTEDLSYTPLVREWFYKAMNTPEIVSISEAYIDSQSGLWVITSSRTIQSNGEHIGVAAVDITLENIVKIAQDFKYPDNYFILLISPGGMMLNIPETWDSAGKEIVHIFNEEITGISEDSWGEIKQKDSTEIGSFTAGNDIEYFYSIYKITPFEDQDKVIQYLMLCVKVSSVSYHAGIFKEMEAELRNEIGFVLVCCGTIGILVLSIIIWKATKRLNQDFDKIKENLRNANSSILRVTLKKKLPCEKPSESGFYGIHDMINAKINAVYEIQSKFQNYPWGEKRPKDVGLFKKWLSKLYPSNLYYGNQMDWRKYFKDMRNF